MSKKMIDGEVVLVQGSGKKPYELKRVGIIYSCTCPAWRNQGSALNLRSCKHLKKLLGEKEELERINSEETIPAAPKKETAENLVMLAQPWDGVQDVTGWWMSEKYDGVRAVWDSGSRSFISRLGNVFQAPEWFKAQMPLTVDLDGELWLGRGKFSECSGIARTQGGDGLIWRPMTFVVFDAPNIPGTFEERLAAVEAWESQNSGLGTPNLKIASQTKVKSVSWLKNQLSYLEGKGAEGVMIREPGSPYERCRSHHLLKVKSFVDCDAVVIGYEPGKGKHKGTVGALLCRLPSGVEFKAGTGLKDADRRDPPKIGSTVICRFFELSKTGVPRFPSFVGARAD